MSSAGPAQPTAMRRLCGCRETGHIREDPEGGGHPSARERSARSALAAASAAAGRKPPPVYPGGWWSAAWDSTRCAGRLCKAHRLRKIAMRIG